MMEELQRMFKSVHNTFAVYVDTESNIHLSEAERRAMPLDELRMLNTNNKKQDDDVNVFTYRHYHYGLLIQNAIKRGLARKKVL